MRAAAPLLAFVLVTPAAAQLPSASAAALGMGDNYTAAARGFNAVAWNPSVLALRTNPGGSFTLMALRGGNGLEPVTLGDLARYSDRVVPDAVREDWLSRIAADGRQHGEGEVGGTWVAAQLGRFAVHAGTRVRALTDVTPGVAELVMFGNAGSDEPRAIDLSGSTLGASAWSTIGVSGGVPIELGENRMALGATVTWTMGHLLASGENSTGRTTAEPVTVQLAFPLVQTTLDGYSANAGTGFGLDLAASLEMRSVTLAAVVQNVASSFSWNPDRLEYRPLTVSIDQADADTRSDAVPFEGAPDEVRARIAALGFDPAWSFGAAWRPDDRLRLSADARFGADDGMLAGPSRHLGAGAEVRPLPWLPVRAGGALVSQTPGDAGWLASAGLGLEAGPWGVNVAAARRGSERMGGATVIMLSLTSVGAN